MGFLRATCSLAATIKLQRPELEAHMIKVAEREPISASPPADFFASQVVQIEDIGAPTNACFFTNSSINPAHW